MQRVKGQKTQLLGPVLLLILPIRSNTATKLFLAHEHLLKLVSELQSGAM